jgi:hypothetical protein
LKLKYIYTLLVISFCWAGCSIVRPAPQTTPTPTYVHIDSFKFLQPSGYYVADGSTSHDIGSIFVFYNDQAVGNFDLPCTFPVIASDSGVLEIEPGISVNGIEDNQSIYPFYTIDTFQFHASLGNVLQHTPTTEYISGLRLALNEDFEQGNGFMLSSGDSALRVVTKNNSPTSMICEGEGSGYIGLSIPGDSSVIVSAQGFTVPVTNGVGTPYLELNYQCSMPFYVGIVGVSTSTGVKDSTTAYYLTGVYPSSTWKKFYLQLANFVSTYSYFDHYLIVIKAALPAKQADGYVLLDNVKVITNPN